MNSGERNGRTDDAAEPIQEIIRKYGEWTAMSIHLGGGEYTRAAPAPDRRLRRILQVAADLTGRPLAGMRVLDLACLEGHYALEFAAHGADVVAIEIREANIEKARYAQRRLGLANVRFVQDDVRNLSRARYGTFDVVICAGILYHLPAPDVFRFVSSIYEVTDRLAIFDTFVALRDEVCVEHEGHRYHGLHYVEHDENASPKEKQAALWASIDNVRSFWLTEPSLTNLMAHVGFTSFYECRSFAQPEQYHDRRTYVAVKGEPARVLTSPPTDSEKHVDMPERRPWRVNQANMRHGPVRRFFKRVLPQPIKNVLKPVLRALHILEPDPTPEWQKCRLHTRRSEDRRQ